MTRPTLRHRLEYALFRMARRILILLPERVALGFGSLVGRLLHSVLPVRRDVVRENLERAFPDRSPEWRDGVAAASYRHLGREAVATFRLAAASAETVVERTVVHGLEELERSRSEGDGAIIVTGHLGNWEIGGAAVAARGLPVDAVAFRQRNPLFNEDLIESRAGLGMRVIIRGQASRAALESIGEGRVPAFVGDQNAGERGLFVDFFGVPASTARGPAVFSRRTGAPIFLGVALAKPGRPHRYEVHIEEVPFEPTGDVAADVRRLTAAHTAMLERWVREAPEQYFWLHKRWKTRPAGE